MYFVNKKWSLFGLCIALLILTSSCDKDLHNHPERFTGRELFNEHCAPCHQKDGMGTFLQGVPANIATKKKYD